MPLFDHFPPSATRRHWHSFHNSWATYLSSQLDTLLPAGYFAEANVHSASKSMSPRFRGLTPPRTRAWAPSPPLASLPFRDGRRCGRGRNFSRSGGPQLEWAVGW